MNQAISLRLGALASCSAALFACSESTDEPVTRTHDSAAGQIARGRYLAKAAVCAACHMIAGGAPFAGGVKLASPFGTFYGMNITPDPVHGIGKWSAEQFYKALHDGVAPDRQLYPAMPYTSYRTMSRADCDAIYDYLMAQKPAAVPNREPDPGTKSMQAIPGFAATLSDDELAHLANHLRAGWGGQPGDVTAANVKALR